MRYQITQTGWSIGQHLIPVGSVINTNAPDDFSKLASGLAPPLNAMPLDFPAWAAMQALYGPVGLLRWVPISPAAAPLPPVFGGH
jgi:hypothetical protein